MRKSKGPVRIGQSQDQNQWRCKICKFLNELTLIECRMCQEPKTVLKEDTKKFQAKVPQNINPPKQTSKIPQKPKNIHGIQDFKQDLGGPKNPRFSKEPEMEQYKKVADNANKKQTRSDMNKLSQKLNAQNVRNPALFNQETFMREYGNIPK